MLNNGANLSQPKFNEMHCISYGMCEQETRFVLLSETNSVWTRVSSHTNLKEKSVAADIKYDLLLIYS